MIRILSLGRGRACRSRERKAVKQLTKTLGVCACGMVDCEEGSKVPGVQIPK